VQELEAIADRIEADLQDRPDRELTTGEIGARLMQELKQLDQIAYVRFASVYRQFRDVGQFKREVDGASGNAGRNEVRKIVKKSSPSETG
jgi:transcriptional repressor NrdR